MLGGLLVLFWLVLSSCNTRPCCIVTSLLDGFLGWTHKRRDGIPPPSQTAPKRIVSLKPPQGSTCQHFIMLCLQPNMFWYIKLGTGNSWHNHVHRPVWHNHVHQPPGETRPRTVDLTEEEQDKVASLAPHGGCAEPMAAAFV
jgi:hypothetical protein